MDLGFEVEESGENLILHLKKDIPGWKRFASELIEDGVILDVKDAREMLKVKGDLVVYEVYHLWKGVEKIKRIYENTGIVCDVTLLNFGVFSPSSEGELFLTYGHLHEKPMGEAYTVLKNECLFLLADSSKTYAIRMKEGDSILIHPKYLHRMISFKKDCLVIAFVPEKAGHNYSVVKNKGFPFHMFYKNKKLRIVKNRKYKSGELELVKKITCKINPIKIFEKSPKELKDILENPENYKKLYFMGKQFNSMKPEEVFGVNAGKVWHVLKEKGPLSASRISKLTSLKMSEVFGGLGWLGREGKIQIIANKKGTLYKLTE